MGWLQAIFSAIGQLFRYLGDKQLLDAGEAKAAVKAQEQVDENEEIANNAAADPAVIDFVQSRFDRSKR